MQTQAAKNGPKCATGRARPQHRCRPSVPASVCSGPRFRRHWDRDSGSMQARTFRKHPATDLGETWRIFRRTQTGGQRCRIGRATSWAGAFARRLPRLASRLAMRVRDTRPARRWGVRNSLRPPGTSLRVVRLPVSLTEMPSRPPRGFGRKAQVPVPRQRRAKALAACRYGVWRLHALDTCLDDPTIQEPGRGLFDRDRGPPVASEGRRRRCLATPFVTCCLPPGSRRGCGDVRF
jgi:hypothetical protein